MGMTIDTAMRNLSMYDIDERGNAELHTWYNGIDDDMRESFAVVTYTIRKYQKIKEICDKFATDATYLQEMAFYDIKDVIEIQKMKLMIE